MMASKSQYRSLFVLLGLVLFSGAMLPTAVSQTTQSQQATSGSALRQTPITHYYWRYLAHQNELDTWATAQAAKGHDGSALRNHLQKGLGLSDADYAPIRTSSVRLTAKVKSLDAQAVAIRAAGPTPTSYAQLQALTAQRETAINAEVSFLKTKLTPDKIARLELFMVHFFSPPNAPSQPTSTTQQTAPAAVQR